jgi:hypothetical protein
MPRIRDCGTRTRDMILEHEGPFARGAYKARRLRVPERRPAEGDLLAPSVSRPHHLRLYVPSV